MSPEEMGGTAVGGVALVALIAKVYQFVNASKAAVAHQDLGSSYERHMYGRLKELETKNEELNEKLFTQSALIGKLQQQVITLTKDLHDVQVEHEEAKRLLKKVSAAYEATKADNDSLRAKIKGINPVVETGREGRPYLPGGAP